MVNYVTVSSDTAMGVLTKLTGGFLHVGMSGGQAHTAALAVMQGIVAKQASVLAFQDVFLITAVLCALGIIPALFIKDKTTAKMEEKSNEVSGQAAYQKA
jgi:hypothetical protein